MTKRVLSLDRSQKLRQTSLANNVTKGHSANWLVVHAYAVSLLILPVTHLEAPVSRVGVKVGGRS
jgi:hypothetical protein